MSLTPSGMLVLNLIEPIPTTAISLQIYVCKGTSDILLDGQLYMVLVVHIASHLASQTNQLHSPAPPMDISRHLIVIRPLLIHYILLIYHCLPTWAS